MIIDAHAHITAPDSLWVWKAGLVSHRGAHGRGNPAVSDDEMRAALNAPVFGATSHLQQLKEAGTGLQLISPRPYQMMHSEKPSKLVHWFCEEANNMIAQQCRLYPDTFVGVGGLPQAWGETPRDWVGELERCVKELGMVGCLVNPDPSESRATNEIPGPGDRWWYPLYEKFCELDVPMHIHSCGCCSPRHTYSVNFILEETVAIMSLVNSDVFKDFPTLKVMVSHGGGAIPYQAGRFQASSLRRARGGGQTFEDALRHFYFDTVLYSKEALELLIKVVGADRCLFGTERPGIGTVKEPKTGRWMDDIRPHIEGIEWLRAEERKLIFEDNARRLFQLDARRTARAAA